MPLMMKGFTLIELLIVVAIIGLLASIAYPSYTNFITNARRSEAIASLVSITSDQERFYTLNDNYASSVTAATGLGLTGRSETDFYTISVNNDAVFTYTLTATPNGWNDPVCNEFTLSNTGVKTINGTGTLNDCWR
jgi:type IV pilus assembly protein PilE